ncbi:hypothetical protein FC764_10160 [Clostridium botulinum]|nr:hypothetical protein [Clostridium botulinum]
MNIKLKKIKDDNFSCIPKLFEDNNFYFKTKRPESLYEGNIKNLLLECKNKSFSIFVEDDLEGLFSAEKDLIEDNAVFINVRLKNMDLLLYNLELFFSEFKKILVDYHIIKMKVYDFDKIGKKVAEEMSFNIEAILREHIYKNNAYHDLIIYSKTNKWE